MEEEEIITTDVPETSEEELEEVDIDTSEDTETEETLDTQEQDIKEETRYTQEEVNSIVKDRLDRFKKKEKEELRKYKYLEDIVKAGTGTSSIDEAIKETADFYRGNGLDIPEFTNLSEEDEITLGRNDATAFLDLDYQDLKEEVDRLANIPRDQRTVREQAKLNVLGIERTKRDNIEKMKAKGYDTSVLDTKEFKDFSDQFNTDTDISKIYEMYQKVYGLIPKQPSSPGSVKTSTTGEVKEYYTPEEAKKFTEEDYDRNPALYEAVQKSMLRWE